MSDIVLGAFADEAGASLEEQVAAMQANGIRHLEARMIDGVNFIDFSVAEARAVKVRLDAADCEVWSIGSPLGKIGVRDPLAPHLERLRHALELAEVMGSRRMRVFSFYLPEGEHHAACRDEVMERMQRMLEIADGSGVLLCHENEKGIYGDTAAACADLLDTFPALGCVFDPANFVQIGEDTLAAWECLHRRVEYLHIKDCRSDGVVVPCGAGDGHLPTLIRAYYAAGGRRFTLEPHLAVFDGLGSLEQTTAQSHIEAAAYPTQRAAFDAAAAALHRCLEALV